MNGETFDRSNLFLKSFKHKWYEICKGESKSQLKETIEERVKLSRQKEGVKDLSDIPTLEGYEEVKDEKGLKILPQTNY